MKTSVNLANLTLATLVWTDMPPLVHCTSSTTSKLACATSCITCRPETLFLCPYPTLLPSAAAAGLGDAPGTPKIEKDVAGEAALDEGGTDIAVEGADFVDVK